MRHRAYLSLGSNIDPASNLPAAVALLRALGAAEVSAVSRAFETAPVGAAGRPVFWNAAVLLLTTGDAEWLKGEVIAGIETRLGRVRDPRDRNAPRTIDLDIALWDDAVGEILGRPVPDPDLLRYAHVAVPLADIAPDVAHPRDGRTLAVIARELIARMEAAGQPPPRPLPGVELDPGSAAR